MNFIEENAKQAAEGKSGKEGKNEQIALQKHNWVPVKLLEKRAFSLPENKPVLGLGTCQHIEIGFHMADKMLIRPYTPTRPFLPVEMSKGQSKSGKQIQFHGSSNTKDFADGGGTFELTVKTYFPDEEQPGGAMSNILDNVEIGDEVEIRGPTGEIVYNGNGFFVIEGKPQRFSRVSLVLGGSGITPGYSLIARVVLTDGDETQIRVVDANKSEQDILLREELEEFVRIGNGQLKIEHVLNDPSEKWDGLKGFVNADILKGNLFAPNDESVVFLCGPPAMIQKAALPALKGM
jgi:nitrate reductase (NAD(P)H)